jgi:maltose/moltooligosaccharide transporter
VPQCPDHNKNKTAAWPANNPLIAHSLTLHLHTSAKPACAHKSYLARRKAWLSGDTARPGLEIIHQKHKLDGWPNRFYDGCIVRDCRWLFVIRRDDDKKDLPMTSALTPGPGPTKYYTGTLSYTKYGLFTLFSWLLWGDFCYTLMGQVGGIYATFLLDKLHMTPATVTILASTIPQLLGVFVGPAVSFKSDRTRSRFGRRIPYIIFTAPMLCLCLVARGFSAEIADFLQTSSIPAQIGISPAWAIMIAIGFITATYVFFGEFVGSVYYYLFNDVVPPQFMGRFQSLFRMVGTGAGMFYSAFVYEYSLEYMKWVFLGAALIYIVGMSLMCWRVREGQYPPITDVTERTGVLTQVKLYFRECFTHPIYIVMFLYGSCSGLANQAGVGGILFSLNLGITMKQLGLIGAVVNLAAILVTYPCGMLVDRYHPLRVKLVSSAFLPFISIGGFFFLHDIWGYLFIQGANIVVWGVIQAAFYPLLMQIFPREKFGQFCSANGMTISFTGVLGSLLAGQYLNWATDGGTIIDNYRFGYLWSGFFYTANIVCLLIVYGYWKKLGGDKNYKPPIT